MTEIVIFGGTSEGRRLAEFCAARGIPAAVSVATGYGAELLPDSSVLEIHTGPMDREEMEEWLRERQPSLVLDATHPYAAAVTENISRCCSGLGLRRLRVLRDSSREVLSGEERGPEIRAAGTVEEAVEFLAGREGNILVTTGSKELKAFTALEHYRERVFARVLPFSRVLEACEDMGIPGSRIFALQGPFSREMNLAMLRMADARWLVTKEAGTAGGFEEKLQAAADAGAGVVIVCRPGEETGVSLEEAMRELEAYGSSDAEKEREIPPRTLILAGAGMGTEETMTVEAVRAVKECQAVFGAPRLAALADQIRGGKPVPAVAEYLPAPVFRWLEEHGECSCATVLFSGDTGFYSGTAGFLEYAGREANAAGWELKILPGISSLSCMAAALGKSWEDAAIVSRHGRDGDVRRAVLENGRVFVLTGGTCRAEQVCAELKGLPVRVYAGENLGSGRERILSGSPEELAGEQFASLTVLWIEKEDIR